MVTQAGDNGVTTDVLDEVVKDLIDLKGQRSAHPLRVPYTAKLVQVIQVVGEVQPIGEDAKDVVQYWTTEGDLLAEFVEEREVTHGG